MEEREVKKNVKTCWVYRDETRCYISAYEPLPDDSGYPNIHLDDFLFKGIFGVNLKTYQMPVEFRLERVVRSRGKFAKRKPRVPAPMNWTEKDVRRVHEKARRHPPRGR